MASDRAQILITAVDQTRTALDSIRNNLGRLGDETRRVQGLLAGLGVSLTLGAFAALVKGAIDSADELNKLSQKIGISVEALSTLQFAAQLSDVGLDTLKTGLKGLSANLTEARSGLGEGDALFQALGISVEDTAGNLKSSDTILLEVADRFASFEDGATKTALAVKLFGKSGMDMIPFLNQGASGIRELMQEAERLGLKLSTESAHDVRIIEAVARAMYWHDLLDSGTFKSVVEIARAEGLMPTTVGRLLRLARLAPDIVEQFMRGCQPRRLTLLWLMRNDIPALWPEQRQMLERFR